MLKKTFSVILISLLILTLSASFCLATDTNATADNTTQAVDENTTNTSETGDDTSAEEEKEPHKGDLFLSGDKILVDYAVQGNAYIIGNEVTITGSIDGNLFVYANKINLDQGSIRYSIFAYADEVNYNGYCNDLYVACENINMTWDSYIIRNVKAVVNNSATFKTAVGGTVDISANSIDFGNPENENDTALIVGDLNYTSRNEYTIPDGVVEGEVHYSKANEITQTRSILNYGANLVTSLVFVIVIYLILKKLTPKFVETTSAFISKKAIFALLVGILALIVVPLISFVLLFTYVGAPLGLILFAIYVLLICLTNSIVEIAIAGKLTEKFNITGTFKSIAILALIDIVIWAIKLIPYAGIILGILFTFIGLGIIVMTLFKRNKKVEEVAEA